MRSGSRPRNEGLSARRLLGKEKYLSSVLVVARSLNKQTVPPVCGLQSGLGPNIRTCDLLRESGFLMLLSISLVIVLDIKRQVDVQNRFRTVGKLQTVSGGS